MTIGEWYESFKASVIQNPAIYINKKVRLDTDGIVTNVFIANNRVITQMAMDNGDKVVFVIFRSCK
jgi:hypothetical protein